MLLRITEFFWQRYLHVEQRRLSTTLNQIPLFSAQILPKNQAQPPDLLDRHAREADLR